MSRVSSSGVGGGGQWHGHLEPVKMANIPVSLSVCYILASHCSGKHDISLASLNRHFSLCSANTEAAS